jgi:cell division septation protein DedD
MDKDSAFRELKFSPPQLAIVFLAILILGLFVFLLGVSVGKSKPRLAAGAESSGPLKTERIVTQAPLPVEVATTTAPVQPQSRQAEVAPQTQMKAAESKNAVGPEKKAPDTAGAKATPDSAAKSEKKPASQIPAYGNAPYYVQIGAVAEKAAAEAFAKRVSALGYPAMVLDPPAKDKKPFYKIRVGPWETKEAAEKKLTELATALKKKKTDFFLVKG